MSTWNLEETQHHLLICNGGSCMRKQGDEVTMAIREEIAVLGADVQVHTTRTRCNGRCEDACVVIAYPQGIWYRHMTPDSGRELVRGMLEGKRSLCNAVYTYEPLEQRFLSTGLSEKGIDKKLQSSGGERKQQNH